MQTERLLGLSAALLALLAASNAAAFCRTTTCDAGALDGCPPDAYDQNGCSTSGIPLIWPERCLSFNVQKNGSPLRHITWQETDSVLKTAYQQWISVDCGGGAHPSFEIWALDDQYGPVECATPEYNKTGPNANVWMFRDGDWPYPGASATLALTTVTFAVKTGEILDADVELNSFATDLSLPGSNTGADLASIVTHEAGHFLGLAHSNDPTATMFVSYTPGDRSFRSLAADDAAGICATYPPGRSTPACDSGPEPHHGFTKDCGGESTSSSSGLASSSSDSSGGCSTVTARPGRGLSGMVAALALLATARARRRRPAR